MNKQVIIALIVGIIIGGLATFGVVSANSSKTAMTSNNTMMEDDSTSMGHGTSETSMADMNAALEGKTGDEFDKEFITQMIEHHQGAIDMANQAKTNAGHDELKKMADDIISAQTSEIEMMKQWQKDWGFTQ